MKFDFTSKYPLPKGCKSIAVILPLRVDRLRLEAEPGQERTGQRPGDTERKLSHVIVFAAAWRNKGRSVLS